LVVIKTNYDCYIAWKIIFANLQILQVLMNKYTSLQYVTKIAFRNHALIFYLTELDINQSLRFNKAKLLVRNLPRNQNGLKSSVPRISKISVCSAISKALSPSMSS